MDALVLIDQLDELVHNARPVPLTDQVRVDKYEIYEILDRMRSTIPEEITRSRSGDANPFKDAVADAIREQIPEIAAATAAAVRGVQPPPQAAPPPPGGPF